MLVWMLFGDGLIEVLDFCSDCRLDVSGEEAVGGSKVYIASQGED